MIRLLLLVSVVLADQQSCRTLRGAAGPPGDVLSCCSSLDNVVALDVVRIRAQGTVSSLLASLSDSIALTAVRSDDVIEVSITREVDEPLETFYTRTQDTILGIVAAGASPYTFVSTAYMATEVQCEQIKILGIPQCYYTANASQVGNFYVA